MPEKDLFNTPEEETARLAAELLEVKKILKEVLQKVAQIEARSKRAFPHAFTPTAPREAAGQHASMTEQPTMTVPEVMQVYDEAVGMAKAGDTSGARSRLEAMNIANLNLLRTEVGASLGKKKPSKPVLVEAVLSRLRESVGLSRHADRRELISRLTAPEEATGEG